VKSDTSFQYRDKNTGDNRMHAQLNMLDATFLYLETAHAPLHIASLQILEGPRDKQRTFFNETQRHIAARAPSVDFITRRLETSAFDLDHPHWQTVHRLDIDHHVRRLVLPKPGSIAQLECAVALLHEVPLDRSKPLWWYYVIEGLESGLVA